MFPQTILAKTCGTNYRNTIKLDNTSKMQYLILCVFWKLLPIFNFWKEEWALGCISIYISHFFNISEFPKILRLKTFGNSCTKFVMLDIKYRFSCGDLGLSEIIKKCQKIMARIVDRILCTSVLWFLEYCSIQPI